MVSGIGFLGAGAIMKEGLTVTGLTTAACLWVVAGVGLAIGGGFYMGAILTSLLVFVTLGALSRLDDYVENDKRLSLIIHTIDKPGQLVQLSNLLEKLRFKVRGMRVKEDEDEAEELDEKRLCIELTVFNLKGLKNAEIIESIRQIEGVTSVTIS